MVVLIVGLIGLLCLSGCAQQSCYYQESSGRSKKVTIMPDDLEKSIKSYEPVGVSQGDPVLVIGKDEMVELGASKKPIAKAPLTNIECLAADECTMNRIGLFKLKKA